MGFGTPVREVGHSVRVGVAIFAAGGLVEWREEVGVDVDFGGHLRGHGGVGRRLCIGFERGRK